MSRIFWDLARRAKLTAMWRRGASTKELTEAFGIKMHSISARAYRMGLGPRIAAQPHEIVRKSIERLGRATTKDLMQDTAMTHNQVANAIKRLRAAEDIYIPSTRLVSAGRGHSGLVEAYEYALVDDESLESRTRSSGEQRINRIKHRTGSAPIPPRHEITAALFGSV